MSVAALSAPTTTPSMHRIPTRIVTGLPLEDAVHLHFGVFLVYRGEQLVERERSDEGRDALDVVARPAIHRTEDAQSGLLTPLSQPILPPPQPGGFLHFDHAVALQRLEHGIDRLVERTVVVRLEVEDGTSNEFWNFPIDQEQQFLNLHGGMCGAQGRRQGRENDATWIHSGRRVLQVAVRCAAIGWRSEEHTSELQSPYVS